MNALKTQIPEIQISFKNNTPYEERHSITQSKDAEQILRSTWDYETIDLQESFKIIFLNRANQVLGIHNHSLGGMAGTVVDIRLILSIALKTTSQGIILAHNHPSGNLKPSNADISLTKKIDSACKLLDIKLLDHIILTSEAYFSFQDDGYL